MEENPDDEIKPKNPLELILQAFIFAVFLLILVYIVFL